MGIKMTIAELWEMKKEHLASWNYENLALPEDTKALLETAMSQGPTLHDGTKIYINNNPGTEIYTVYMKRTMGKEKGDDLLNDVCPIFEPALNFFEQKLGGQNIMYLDFKEKCDSFKRIRKLNGYAHENVRAIKIDEKLDTLSEQAKRVLGIDCNVMIFTIAKTRADACHIGENVTKRQLQLYQNILETHFMWEEDIISNCVDIPILPLIEQNKEEYFVYLREGIDAIKALTQSAICCASSILLAM